MNSINKIFYEFIQVSLGCREKLSRTPNKDEWMYLFQMAEKQAVTGFLYSSLDSLSARGQKPPLDSLYEWIGVSEQMKQRNLLLNKKSVELVKRFKNDGFRTCLLKGQGNALMYPDPLLRTPGDIDIWVDGSRKVIRDYVKNQYPNAQDGDMHIEYPIFEDIPVEVHYFPRYSNVPKYDKRLKAWFMHYSDVQFSNRVKLSSECSEYVCVPTAHFNAVQQMSHIMGHFFNEGVGLRQFVDYFYVLRNLHEQKVSDNFEGLFENLGMLKFARGVMWVEQNVLGLEETYLLTIPDEKIGKVILKEIEYGGNFGQFDKRYKARKYGMLMRGISDSYRLLQLSYYFPLDAFWKIVDKVVNQRWKIKL